MVELCPSYVHWSDILVDSRLIQFLAIEFICLSTNSYYLTG